MMGEAGRKEHACDRSSKIGRWQAPREFRGGRGPKVVNMLFPNLLVFNLLTPLLAAFVPGPPSGRSWSISSRQLSEKRASLESISEDLYEAFQACKDDLAKTCKVKVAPVSTSRLGLIATDAISKGEVALAMPYDERFVLSGDVSRKTVFKGILPEDFL